MSNQQPRPLKREEQSSESSQTELISRLYSTLAPQLTAQFTSMGKRFDILEGAHRSIGNKVDKLEGRIDKLEERFDRRFDGVEGRPDRLETNVAAILRILQSRKG